jgi:hypothetical protein
MGNDGKQDSGDALELTVRVNDEPNVRSTVNVE